MLILACRVLLFVFMFQVWILRYTEGTIRSHTIEQTDVFNWTATYRRGSDIPIPYSRWVYYDEHVKQNAKLDHNYAANKTKKLSCSIAVLPLNTGYSKVLHSPVCVAARHTRHKTLIFIFYTISMSPSVKQYISHHQIYL